MATVWCHFTRMLVQYDIQMRVFVIFVQVVFNRTKVLNISTGGHSTVQTDEAQTARSAVSEVEMLDR